MPANDPQVPPGGRFRHPLGWYDLAVPPGWVYEAGSDPPRFVGPEGQASAVISVAKTQGVVLPRARCRLLHRSLPDLVAIERRGEEEGRRDGLSWARSEELLGKRLPWWKRLFQRPEPRTILITACFTRASLIALLTVEVEPETAERHRLMIDAMIGSVRLCEAPAPSPDEFVERFMALARERFPSRMFATGDEPLTVLVDGAQVALDQPYRARLAEPTLGERVYEPVFHFLRRGPLHTPGTERFAEVKDRILPAIKPMAWVRCADNRLPARHRLLRIPFPNDTAVVFVVDYDVAMRFISVEESERWESPAKLMLRTALDNLAYRTDEPPEQPIVAADGITHAVAVRAGDGYDAARLLLPDLRERLSDQFGDDFAVAIPNRDVLIAFRTDNVDLVRQMLRVVRRDADARPYPITDALFRVTAQGVEPYQA